MKLVNHKIETWDTMTFEGWWAYMYAILLMHDLKDTHYICKDSDGQSWLKLKK
jgi:hypothetical protein